MNEHRELALFRQQIPFLQEIPKGIYFQLSTREWVYPSKSLQQFITELSDLLDHYVMPYKAKTFDLSMPLEKHLCATIRGASLSSRQRLLLEAYEQKAKQFQVTLSIYQKPLQLIDGEDTSIARYIKSGSP